MRRGRLRLHMSGERGMSVGARAHGYTALRGRVRFAMCRQDAGLAHRIHVHVVHGMLVLEHPVGSQYESQVTLSSRRELDTGESGKRRGIPNSLHQA